ncbi:NotI family restriction endonuclease [Candidatus Poriferisocius sp.]|uniref:NotI family restriction endonuclease n=1 Tax=Candidatus Poriferisocius sp. TaxID=3101276 RepID=UPI003B591C68
MPNNVKTRYGIAEWYGKSFTSLSSEERVSCATHALGETSEEHPACPFQADKPPCSKRGGVCSIRRYTEGTDNRIGDPIDDPVITCPRRFEEQDLVTKWLTEVANFPIHDTEVAREVPFMRSTETNKPAGKIDMVIAHSHGDELRWHALEIQAVYFSGKGMTQEFQQLRDDEEDPPPFPDAIRHPDWRSSSAKRLMPQLDIKAPTVRRWGAKLAIAIDRPFFQAVGGASETPSKDLNDGDIIWLVVRLAPTKRNAFTLVRDHWEVLTLEDTKERLQAARTVSKSDFEAGLGTRLKPL